MAPIAQRVTLRGRVTGVGFRYRACEVARDLHGLTGWVRNADRGTVECLVQGPPAAVETMVAWLRHGPPGAEVRGVEVESRAVDDGLVDFAIRL